MLAPLAGAAPDSVATGVRVLLADASTSLLDVTVPGSARTTSSQTGWKVKRTTWTWQGTIAERLTKVKLVGKTPGTLKLTVTAKGATFPASPALPLRATSLPTERPARCGETAFTTGDCVAQTGRER